MAMTYTSLVANKGISGSIANWVSYSRLDLPPIIDEAQALLYAVLRVREMLTEYVFRVPSGNSEAALPARFLDPIGAIHVPTQNTEIRHRDHGLLLKARSYTTTSGTLGAAPLTTTNGSSSVSVAQTSHGFNQNGIYTISGSTAVGGLTLNSTFPITSITDADHFVIDASLVGTASSGATGGGSAVAYSCDNLIQTSPQIWAIWNEKMKFDGAFTDDSSCQLQYYQSLPLLSSSNPTNFLTDRYPHLMRTACVASAADFMKDDTEYQKGMTRLAALATRINVENDGYLRGAEIYTETP